MLRFHYSESELRWRLGRLMHLSGHIPNASRGMRHGRHRSNHSLTRCTHFKIASNSLKSGLTSLVAI